MYKRSLLVSIFVLGILLNAAYSQAVSVGPVKLQYSADPGQNISGQLTLMNDGKETQTFYPSFEKFTEDNGTKVFTKEESDLATWFQMPQSVALAPGQSENVPFTIAVPANAGPGGHFAVIWWSTSPPSGSGQQVAIVTRAGILVYLTVSGNIVEGANIDKFYVIQSFPWLLPDKFFISVHDSGNVSIEPAGTITVKNLFGGVRANLKVNPYGADILPSSTKNLDTAWSDTAFAFGLYHAHLSLAYGSGKMLSKDLWFPVLGWIPIYVILGFFLLFFVIPKFLKWYIRRIIASAKDSLKN